MNRIPSYCLDYYNKSIVQMIMENTAWIKWKPPVLS